ncbi:MAG: GIY-YIG nuclease family protein [Rubricoccaceae bacterium]
MSRTQRTYFVYIISNAGRSVLYIGMTNDLHRRMREHKDGAVEGFSKQYRAGDLLWFDSFSDVNEAIAREKQIKNWHRDWKWNLVRESNPELRDLTPELIHL